MNFIISWIVSYILIMFSMCTDNIFWISSSAEYDYFKKLGWFKYNGNQLMKEKKLYRTKINYVVNYRIKSVLVDKRDIIPGLITSFIMTIIILFM